MKPLISVIVPIYNSEKFLDDCIQSLLRQTHKNIEIILINDGSTDRSLEICNSYAAVDKRIVVVNQINAGVSAARNKGISIANGEFIGFVDSDDYLEEQMYEKLLKAMLSEGTDVATLYNYRINLSENNHFGTTKNISSMNALKAIYRLAFPTSLWAYLYSSTLIKDMTLNKEVHFFEDFLFNSEVIENTNRISLCHENLYNYRKNDNSTNRQTINDKKMSCLRIYPILKCSVENQGIVLFDEINYFRVHCLISILASISRSKSFDSKYFFEAKSYAYEIMKDGLKSKHVPLKYKIYMTVFATFPKSFARILYFVKYK